MAFDIRRIPQAQNPRVVVNEVNVALSEIEGFLESISAGGGVAWGGITGTLSDQTDLQSALDGKANTSHTHSASDITSGTFSYARLPISSAQVSNWDTAFGWGDHAAAGYFDTAGTGLSGSSGTVSVDLSENLAWTGRHIFNGQIRPFAGTLDPPQLTGDVDDYAPTGISGASVLRIDPGPTNRTITGMIGGGEGRAMRIMNKSSSADLILSSQDSASATTNRFSWPVGTTVTLGARSKNGDYSSAGLRYDSLALRWIIEWVRST